MPHNEDMSLRIGVLLGWGITIYAIMFLVWSAFVTYGFVEGVAPRLLGFLVLLVVGATAGRSLRVRSWRDILPYSFVWGIMMFILDAIMTVPFTGWYIYSDWNVWIGYALVVLAPLLALHPTFNRFFSSSGV
jgi:hypothetical protein